MCHPWAPMPSFTVPSPNALMVRPVRSLFAKDSAMLSLFSTPGPIMLNSCSLVSRYCVKVVGGGINCGGCDSWWVSDQVGRSTKTETESFKPPQLFMLNMSTTDFTFCGSVPLTSRKK